MREPIMAVVGRLQFDVIQYRLKTEYSVDTILEPLDAVHARWIEGDPKDISGISTTMGCRMVEDSDAVPAVLLNGDWALARCIEKNPNLVFSDTAPIRNSRGK
jgi:peptide chain release factor 3